MRWSTRLDSNHSTQSFFIKGKSIANNIVAAEELISNIQKHNLSRHIQKEYFAKAFDIVDWDFLHDLLRTQGFIEHWMYWILAISTPLKAES